LGSKISRGGVFFLLLLLLLLTSAAVVPNSRRITILANTFFCEEMRLQSSQERRPSAP
jgi:hypothetical protein